MSDQNKPEIGSIAWVDLTIDNTETIRDFYCDVIGWEFKHHNVGDYDDFDIIAPGSGKVVTGICHARGENAGLPAQWLVYVAVSDAAASAQRCLELGGQILHGPRTMGSSQFCVIQDPAGAVLALISQ